MRTEVIVKKDEIKVSVGEILYYLFWCMMLFAKGVGMYEGMTSYKVILLLSFSCIILKLLLEKHTVAEAIWEMCLLGLAGLIYLISTDKAPLINIFMLLGLKNVPVKRIFKIGLAVWGTCFLYRALCEVTGAVTGLAIVHEKLGLGPVIRWSFGYPHPNVLQISYAVLAALILYMTKKEKKELLLLIEFLFLGNCYVFLYSVSYTGVILVTLFFLIFYYFQVRKVFSAFERICIQSILPFCIIVSIGAPYMIDTAGIVRKIGEFLNKAVNNRFLASSVYLYNGIAPFGKNLAMEDITFALDSSYVSLLVTDGWIIFGIAMASYFIVIRKYMEENRRKELSIILAFLIAGISEPFLFNTSFKNLSLLFVGEYFFQYFSKLGKQEYGSNIALKEGRLSLPKVFGRMRKMKKQKNQFVLGTVCCGLIASILYQVFAHQPDCVYISKGNADCVGYEVVYLDKNDLPDDFHGMILEYRGPDDPMYCFTGNIIQLEHIRGLVSWGLIGGVLFGVVYVFILYLKKDRDDENRDR